MNFPDVILYIGGVVASKGKNFGEMLFNSILKIKDFKSPYYGDSKENKIYFFAKFFSIKSRIY